MDMQDAINAVAARLGHTPARSGGIHKTVADDVMTGLLEMMPGGRCGEGELRRLISSLAVDNVHAPGRGKLRIQYEGGE